MKKMLVADDSVTIQKVIALTFSEEPFEIQSVGTGSDALEKVKDWRPDIILADVIMPQVNGYELSKAVKDNQDTQNIPVLLLAGTFEAFDEEEAKAAGADDFITKPFESGELIEKVNDLLNVSAQAPSPVSDPVPELIEEPAPETKSGQMSVQTQEPPMMQAPVTRDDTVTEPPSQPIETVPDAPHANVEELLSVEEVVSLEDSIMTDEPSAVEEVMTTDEFVVPEEPVVTEAVPGPGQTAGQSPEPQIPESPQPVETSQDEPDIWDILSEADSIDVTQAPEAADFPSSQPSLGAMEGGGVVDVGSFEVGLDRTEGPQIEDLVSMEPEQPLASTDSYEFKSGDPGAPSEEKSKVEERERDFFGFETAGSGKDPEGSIEDAIEEITFDLETKQLGDPVPDMPGDDVSFVIPEPDAGAGQQTGDTVPPETFTIDSIEQVDEVPFVVVAEEPDIPEALVVPEELEMPETVKEPPLTDESLMIDEIQTADISVMAEDIPIQESPVVPEPAQISQPSAIQDIPEIPAEPVVSMELSDDQPPAGVSPEAAATDEVAEVEFTLAEEPAGLPDGEPSADLEVGLPAVEETAPAEPEPVVDSPAPAQMQESTSDLMSGDSVDIPNLKDADLEAMVRAIVEEKVEKVAWEVIPELSEVLIKEAIDKIKGGS